MRDMNKVKLVQFVDGQYGIRKKYWFFGWSYLDIELMMYGNIFFRRRSHSRFSLCKEKKKERAIAAMQAYYRALRKHKNDHDDTHVVIY